MMVIVHDDNGDDDNHDSAPSASPIGSKATLKRM